MGYIVVEYIIVIVNYQIINSISYTRKELDKKVEIIIPRLARTLNLFSSFLYIIFSFYIEACILLLYSYYLIN
jgi:hypothetical protein